MQTTTPNPSPAGVDSDGSGSTFWRLRVGFYQYNDGSSNNGSFARAVHFTNEAEAVRVRDAIQKAIEAGNAHVGMEDSDPDLPDYIPGCCGGYYKWVALYRVNENESPVGKRVGSNKRFSS
jgi:hypothetical protein